MKKLDFKRIYRHLIEKKYKQILLIITAILFLNGFISITTGYNIVEKSVKRVLESVGIYTEQVKEVVIKSDGYDQEEPGSWKITKKAEWTDTNKVKVTMDLDTVVQNDNRDKDVVFVLNALGERETSITDIRNSLTDLTTYLLRNGNNKLAFIKSDDSIVDFTNDSAIVNGIIENTHVKNYSRNYTLSIVNLSKLLKNYVQDENRDLVILFLTDGAPSTDTPNQIAEYEILKDKYPFMIMNGIQYEKGTNIIKELKEISDRQYTATSTTIKDILYEAALSPEKYEKLEINDFLDTTYYEVDTGKDIRVTTGTSNLNTENQTINWDIGSDFITGRKASITINLTLKDPHYKNKGFYPTNKKTEIKSQLKEQAEKSKTSNDTNVLKNYYKVTYDTNSPSDCDIKETKTDTMIIYNNIAKRTDSLICPGYLFKGWELADNTVPQMNEDTFIMPEKDVTVRAIWTKVAISKSMDGTIHEKDTLWKIVQNDALNDRGGAKVYTGEEIKDYDNPIYYYTSNSNSNVIFGNFCWQIVRTADKGGVKLLYNGVAQNGKCTNNGEDSQLLDLSSFNFFEAVQGNGKSSIESLRYMYNKNLIGEDIKYEYSNSELRLVTTTNKNGNSEYYFSKSEPLYSDGNYSLVDSVLLGKWSDLEEKMAEGWFTCFSTSSSGTCKTAYYVYGVDKRWGSAKVLEIKNGQNFSKANEGAYIGLNYTKEGGKYVIQDAIKVSSLDLSENIDKYEGYYKCRNGNGIECTDLRYLIRYNGTDTVAEEKIKFETIYGADVKYEDGKYVLLNKKKSKDIFQSSKNASEFRYTCFNDIGECETVTFFLSGVNGSADYVELNNGDTIEKFLEDRLYSIEGINDSTIKSVVDSWFENELLEYISYLDDEVYCNDLTIENMGGFDKSYIYWNSGTILRNYYNPNPTLACNHLSGRYTVSNNNGNGLLKYPVGLLNGDEAYLMGSTYRTTGAEYWLLSPYRIDRTMQVNFVNKTGRIGDSFVRDPTALFGVRPVITLKHDIGIQRGDGSIDNPYVIEAEAIGYDIKIDGNENVNSSKIKSSAGAKITLNYDGVSKKVITSFKMNGQVIEGNSFTMPNEDVVISDIVLIDVIVIESEHNPYPNNLNTITDGIQGKVYGEAQFPGAKSLTITLDIQTESTSYDWVYLYDSATSTTPINNQKYGGSTRTTHTITVNSDYVKIVFRTDGSGNNYYGFKATVVPNY